jgi:hypothetical protein
MARDNTPHFSVELLTKDEPVRLTFHHRLRSILIKPEKYGLLIYVASGDRKGTTAPIPEARRCLTCLQ